MHSPFFIRLPASPNTDHAEIDYWQEGQQGASESTHLSAIAELATGESVIVFIHASRVSFMQATIPTRNRQRIIDVIPYALEENVACDIDTLHFAIGSHNEDGSTNVAIIEKAYLAETLAQLRAVNIEPEAIVADIQALPIEKSSWTLLHEADSVLLRTSPQTGFSMEPGNTATLLAYHLQEIYDSDDAENNRPSTLLVLNGPDQDRLALDLDSIDEADAIDIVQAPVDPSIIELLAQHYDASATINLLQGPYSRHEQMGKLWRPWRPALALILLLILINISLVVSNYMHLQTENDRLSSSIEQIYRDTFPNAKRVVNARVQMEQQLKTLRGQSQGGGQDQFLKLLNHYGDASRAMNGLELQRINFKNGAFDLALSINDLPALDKLKQTLINKSGRKVEIRSATSVNNRVDARLHISAPTS